MQTVGTEQPEITLRQDVEAIKSEAPNSGRRFGKRRRERRETGEVRGGEERRLQGCERRESESGDENFAAEWGRGGGGGVFRVKGNS